MHLVTLTSILVLTFGHGGTASPPSQHSTVSTDNGMTILESFPLLTKRAATPDNTCGDKGAGNNNSYTCSENRDGLGGCCSAWGYCGSEPIHCKSSNGCQPEFGTCSDASASGTSVTSTTTIVTNTSTTSTSGPTVFAPSGQSPLQDTTRCGHAFDDMSCPAGQCCSWKGYCGSGASYCSVPDNCQLDYGMCDSKVWPEGHRTSLDVRFPVKNTTVIDRCTKANTVALTYDDGPGQYTSELLDILKDHNAKATFFVSGNTKGAGELDTTAWRARLLQRMVQEGHQVASHGWAHLRYNTANVTDQKEDLVKNEMAIRNVIGGYPAYFRPPYDECSAQSGCFDTVSQMGYRVVAYQYDSGDWASNFDVTDASARADDIFTHLDPKKDSAMFIIHDINQFSATVYTAYLLDLISKKKMEAVTLGDCTGVDDDDWYYKSSTKDRIGKQPKDAPADTKLTSGGIHTADSRVLGFLRFIVKLF